MRGEFIPMSNQIPSIQVPMTSGKDKIFWLETTTRLLNFQPGTSLSKASLISYLVEVEANNHQFHQNYKIRSIDRNKKKVFLETD